MADVACTVNPALAIVSLKLSYVLHY